MDTNELRKKSDKDLREEIAKLSQQLFALRMQRGTEQNVKTHRFGELRRQVARIKTVMAENAKKGDAK